MLRWPSRRGTGALTAAAILVGSIGTVAASPASTAFAQAGEDCIREELVRVGEDDDGNPLYEVQRVDICRDSGGGRRGGGPNTCEHPNPAIGVVPCVHPVHGWWSHTSNCWVRLASPQPSAGDEEWGSNDPADGDIYSFACPQPNGSVTFERHFLAEAPEAPSVSQVAQVAKDRLPLVGADIGIAPDPDGVGLVGVHVWLWTNNPDDTWGPLPASASVPGLTVTARAQATEIRWDMGDGRVEVCDGPGEPYRPEFGSQEPECGHVYSYPSLSRPDGRYQITATTVWRVEWWVEPRGSGADEVEWETRESTTSVQINELQVVTS